MTGEPVKAHPKPLKRPRKPRRALARYVRPKAKRATPRRTPYKTSDPKREAWCRGQPCINRTTMIGNSKACAGPIDAAHLGPRAHARCAPQCRKHHSEWHAASGFSKGWKREARTAWADHALCLADIGYDQHTGKLPAGVWF
jgi:hypothetical protein